MNQPFVVAYGMGVDSTAMLIGLSGIGIRPDLILFADVGGEKDETYAYQTIMDRERCKEEIRVAGLPVPPKSSCFFCPAMKPQEIDKLPIHLLRRIVIMEARAKPRLTDIDGLWRKGCKGTRGSVARPGSITEYIRQQGLLPSEEIDRLVAQVPTQIVAYQEAFGQGEEIPTWEQFFCSLSDDSESESERLSLPVLSRSARRLAKASKEKKNPDQCKLAGVFLFCERESDWRNILGFAAVLGVFLRSR